jgi:DNA-binding winged helix-turn-helix (wHTH) protein
MDAIAEPPTCRFDDFLLDWEGRALFHLNGNGERTQIPIGSRAFEILCLLIDRRGEFVSRREIMAAVWPNAVVEDSNLSVQMAALRRVLDAERTRGSCIQTVPGRGYRFLPQVTEAISRRAVADTRPPLDDQVLDSASASPERAGVRVVRQASLSWRHMPRLAGLVGAACLFVLVLFAAYVSTVLRVRLRGEHTRVCQ